MAYSKWRPLMVLLASTCLLVSTASSRDYEIIEVPTGQNRDVFFEINLKGHVYLRIAAPPGGEACANFWWIKWPLGNIQDLGRHCDSAKFEMPGVFDLAVSAKLRVGGAKNALKIVASESSVVANSITITFP